MGKGRREEEEEKVAEKGNIGESSRLGGGREAVWSERNNNMAGCSGLGCERRSLGRIARCQAGGHSRLMLRRQTRRWGSLGRGGERH